MRIIKVFTTLLITLSLSSFALAGDWSKIRVGTEGAYEPWNYTNAAGELVGAELDLARDLCARMNADCEFIQQDWDGIIPALVQGKYDVIMAGMSITEERMKTISFSSAYMTEPAKMSTVKGSPLTTLSTAKSPVTVSVVPSKSKASSPFIEVESTEVKILLFELLATV